MTREKSSRRLVSKAAAFLIAVMLLVPWNAFAASPEYTDFQELNGKTVAMLTGAPFEEMIRSRVPEVGGFAYFGKLPDMIMALRVGKVDACLLNNAVGAATLNRYEGVALFPVPLDESSFGFAFPKGSGIRTDWQLALDSIPEEVRQDAWNRWTGMDESVKVLPEQDWPGSNGTVRVACTNNLNPMSFLTSDGELAGFEIEMTLLAARELDVRVEFEPMDFAAVLSSVQSGKVSFGLGSIIVTDERRESLDFAVHYPATFMLVVRDADHEGPVHGSGGVAERFKQTFLVGSRYKMVLAGLVRTVVMAAAAGALGFLLAYGLVRLRRRGNRFVDRAVTVYCSLVAGIPAVVILMVLYYLLFGGVNVSALLVGILGFTLIFGAGAHKTIWNAVSAVDKAQFESALALGYSETRAFNEVILPQARSVYFPALQSQFASLFKETSVAGFITVTELTLAGDLIRSQTMQAFFPLFSVAMIYFALSRLIGRVTRFINLREKRKHEERKIKGVDPA